MNMINIPNCELCNSPMKFFDEAWVEDKLLIVASVICTNDDCLNSSVIYIYAQQGNQPTTSESAHPYTENCHCSSCRKFESDSQHLS